MTVQVNSQSANAVESNGFLSVNRVWQVGDQVELSIPADVQVSRLPDNQNTVAFTYGPLTLSAGLGTASMTTTGHAWTIAATKPSGLQETITINSSTTINNWVAKIKDNLVHTAGKLEFTLKNTDSDSKLLFVPHFSRYLDRYGIYWKLAGTTGASVPATTCVATGGTTSGTPTNQGGSGNVGAGGRNTGETSVVNEGGTGGTSPLANQGGNAAQTNSASLYQGGASTHIVPAAGGSGTSLQTPTGGKGTLIASGGNTLVGTPNATANDGEQNSSGCSCKLDSNRHSSTSVLGLIVGLGLLARRRNQRA
jgi:MYXO-CTERM domain-containing protein